MRQHRNQRCSHRHFLALPIRTQLKCTRNPKDMPWKSLLSELFIIYYTINIFKKQYIPSIYRIFFCIYLSFRKKSHILLYVPNDKKESHKKHAIPLFCYLVFISRCLGDFARDPARLCLALLRSSAGTLSPTLRMTRAGGFFYFTFDFSSDFSST